MFRLLFALIFFILAGCSHQNINDYQGKEPYLNIKEFFNGKLKAYGILQDRSGRVTRQFTADIIADWEGDTGTLDETFYFDDGEVSTRLWKLDVNGRDVIGTAGDVKGKATGITAGNAVNLRYVLTVPYKNTTIDISIDDWMFLVTDNKLINKSRLTKFGFRVGDLTLLIEKTDEPTE